MFVKNEPFIQDTPKDKVEKKLNPVQYYVKYSFMITYVLLITSSIITFIEAIRTTIPEVRHILNLETCISVVAGYFYSIFVEKIEEYGKADKEIDWADITQTRYIDWSITTPMMLLTLCIVLAMNTKTRIDITTMISIITLNYFMLYVGYLGESKKMERFTAMIVGFIAFFAMFGIIFIKFVIPKYVIDNYILYGMYLLVWTIYGIAYMFNEEYKNITMNILDCIAKCLIGLGLWVYYTKIIKLY
jgi:bacteriorhodopsin